MVPEGEAIRQVGEGKDLLHAAVAVRSDDEDATRQDGRGGLGQPEDDVVVELALRPVVDQVVAAEAALHFLE